MLERATATVQARQGESRGQATLGPSQLVPPTLLAALVDHGFQQAQGHLSRLPRRCRKLLLSFHESSKYRHFRLAAMRDPNK